MSIKTPKPEEQKMREEERAGVIWENERKKDGKQRQRHEIDAVRQTMEEGNKEIKESGELSKERIKSWKKRNDDEKTMRENDNKELQ